MVALQTLKSSTRAEQDPRRNLTARRSHLQKTTRRSGDFEVMESDVKVQGISESLSVGESTVGVARQAAETVTDLLTQMKGKIVAAQASNVDRSKIQTDVAALRSQITTVVGAAQFNGLNLVDGSTVSTNVLASLDRDSAGNVTVSNIAVAGQNLSVGGYTASDVFSASTAGTISGDGDTLFGRRWMGRGSDDITIANGGTWPRRSDFDQIGSQTASLYRYANDLIAAQRPRPCRCWLKTPLMTGDCRSEC